MRYVYFVEGVVFVTLSLLVAREGGLPAIIACSIVCSTVFSGAYGVRRVSHYFGFPFSEVALGWLQPMANVLLFYLPIAGLLWWSLTSTSDMARLGLNALVGIPIGAYLFLRFGIPGPFQDELLGRVPARVAPILKRVFPKPAS